MKEIIKRLLTLEKATCKGVLCDVTYKDGTKKRLPMMYVLSLYTDNKPDPQIKDIAFIGNTSNQGILPDLIREFVATK